MATQKPEVYKPFVVLCIAHIISRVLVHLVTKSQRLFPYFQVELFNDVIVDLTGSRVIPEIDMAAAQIGSNSISAHRTRNKIPTAIPMFSMSSSTMLFIAALCAEIELLPVLAAAISISGTTRLPVTSSTVPLNSSTSKTWVRLLESSS